MIVVIGFVLVKYAALKFRPFVGKADFWFSANIDRNIVLLFDSVFMGIFLMNICSPNMLSIISVSTPIVI